MMSIAEQLETPRGAPQQPPRDALLEEEAFIESQLTEPAKNRARLRPLLALAPYVARYKGRAILALISLTIAAITTLIVPVAVRWTGTDVATTDTSSSRHTSALSRYSNDSTVSEPVAVIRCWN